MTNPSNPKPARRARSAEIHSAITRLAGLFEYGDLMADTTPAAFLNLVAEAIEQQRALSATRKADAETVRHALTHSVTTAEHDRALEALDRLGKE
jgi:hypothetical protein